MSPEFVEDLDGWRCYAKIHSQPVEVNLAGLDSMPKLTKEDATEHVVETVEENWAEIRSALVDALLGVHNARWVEPDSGYPALEEEEFLEKLKLQEISFDAELYQKNALWLYFSDSEVFGGHGIEVFWQKGSGIQWEFIGWRTPGACKRSPASGASSGR